MTSSIVLTIISILILTVASYHKKVKSGGIKTNGITVVRLEGTAEVYIGTVPNRTDPINGDSEEAWCFNVDVMRVETNKVIAKGTDCIIVGANDGVCGTLSVTSTTFFDEGDGNIIVTRGQSTIQPTASDSSLDFTHITGQHPASTDKNTVLYGTGKFTKSKGVVSLSGAVNMTHFNPGSTPSGSITFNCLFVLDLTTKKYGGVQGNDGNLKYYAVQQELVSDHKDNLGILSDIDNKDDPICHIYRYLYMIIAGMMFVNIMIGIWCYYRNKNKQYIMDDFDDLKIERIDIEDLDLLIL